MIARNEVINYIFSINKVFQDELNMFDQMDKERYEKEEKVFKFYKEPQKGDSKFYNYRLMSEQEVPEWIKSRVNKFITNINQKKKYQFLKIYIC